MSSRPNHHRVRNGNYPLLKDLFDYRVRSDLEEGLDPIQRQEIQLGAFGIHSDEQYQCSFSGGEKQYGTPAKVVNLAVPNSKDFLCEPDPGQLPIGKDISLKIPQAIQLTPVTFHYREDSGLTDRTGIIIAVVAIFLVLLVSAGIIIGFIVIRRRRRKHQEEEEEYEFDRTSVQVDETDPFEIKYSELIVGDELGRGENSNQGV